MKKHTIYGSKAIANAGKKLGYNSFLKYTQEIAQSHQEKWDGSMDWLAKTFLFQEE